jgi:ATP-dependent DNA helicase PIF1
MLHPVVLHLFFFLVDRRTAHSQFGLPLVLSKESCCGIEKKSKKAQLLMMANLIIWDETPMIHKFAIESF